MIERPVITAIQYQWKHQYGHSFAKYTKKPQLNGITLFIQLSHKIICNDYIECASTQQKIARFQRKHCIFKQLRFALYFPQYYRLYHWNWITFISIAWLNLAYFFDNYNIRNICIVYVCVFGFIWYLVGISENSCSIFYWIYFSVVMVSGKTRDNVFWSGRGDVS